VKYNLSEITEVIKNRRTIYPEQYSTRKIHKEIVQDVLNNAVWAPTHGKTQPWRFMVYMEDSKIELSEFLSNLYSEKFTGEDFNSMKFDKLRNRPILAPVVIAVVMTPDPNNRILEIEEVSFLYGVPRNRMAKRTKKTNRVFNYLEIKCINFFPTMMNIHLKVTTWFLLLGIKRWRIISKVN